MEIALLSSPSLRRDRALIKFPLFLLENHWQFRYWCLRDRAHAGRCRFQCFKFSIYVLNRFCQPSFQVFHFAELAQKFCLIWHSSPET